MTEGICNFSKTPDRVPCGEFASAMERKSELWN